VPCRRMKCKGKCKNGEVTRAKPKELSNAIWFLSTIGII
jgi:hypothetical protein